MQSNVKAREESDRETSELLDILDAVSVVDHYAFVILSDVRG